MRLRTGLLTVLLVVVGASSAAAQEDRAQLIDQARITSDESLRRDLFVAAADPAVRDSLWAVAGFELAQIMLDLGDDDAARAWLRWVLRHSDWEIDRAYFAPSLVSVYDQVAATTADEDQALSAVTSTEWRWPEAFTAEDPGRLEVLTDDADATLIVEVEGQDELEAGESVELAPGTYDLVVSADGYEPVRMAREILPGVETVLSLNLVPVLTEPVVQRLSESVLRLRYASGGAPVCANALSVGDGLAVTSLSALGGRTGFEVPIAGTQPLSAEVVGTDPSRDLALIRVSYLDGPSPSQADLLTQGYAWSVFRSGCAQEVEVARTRLAAAAPVDGLPSGAVGAPLVDRDGSVMGLIAVEGRISPIQGVHTLVEEAAGQLESGGFPTVWAAVGVAAVGGVAALLLGGGDKGADDTGSVILTIPSG